jgi:hypothetical protein
MANVEALLVSHPPALVDTPSKVLGFGQQPSVGQSVNARQRAPSPTMPLLTVARSLRSRQTLPLSKVKELNTSLSSTLSPAVSTPFLQLSSLQPSQRSRSPTRRTSDRGAVLP